MTASVRWIGLCLALLAAVPAGAEEMGSGAPPSGAIAPPAGQPPAAMPGATTEPAADVYGPPLPAPVDSPAAAGAKSGHDLSPWGMFMAADWVVKAVMLSLLAASVMTWTVWLVKSLELIVANRKVARARRYLETTSSLDDAAAHVTGKLGTVFNLVAAARRELDLTAAGMDKDGVKERVASRLQQLETASGRRMNSGTSVLAIVGSTAPFIGLFGTVWGIMNSFIGIAEANTTNLAVVAPGIAEALLATAVGLLAAIPAVVMYNLFARSISRYRAQIAAAAAEVLRLTSRDLDRRQAAAVDVLAHAS